LLQLVFLKDLFDKHQGIFVIHELVALSLLICQDRYLNGFVNQQALLSYDAKLK